MSEAKIGMTYREKLNLPTVSITTAKTIIKNYIKRYIASKSEKPKSTFHIIGPAGVGKTFIGSQIAKELSQELELDFNFNKIVAPFFNRDDFIVPMPDKENGTFKNLYADFLPDKDQPYGILLIDEKSRGDRTLQQLLWQLENDNTMHTYRLPSGWFVISTDNPDDQEYQMETMEDAAGIRRTIHLYIDVNPIDFITYAMAEKFHPSVIEFVQAHPDMLYDFKAQEQGAIYANPASFEKISDILNNYSVAELPEHYNHIEVIISGLLNNNMAKEFMAILKEIKLITPSEIFFEYGKVRDKIKKYIDAKDNATLGEIMISFVTYMVTSKPEYTIDLLKENFAKFITDIPIDLAGVFISQLSELAKNHKEDFEYMSEIHTVLSENSKEYVENFTDRLISASEDNTLEFDKTTE